MPTSAEDILKTYMKNCFKGDRKKLFIKIRQIRKILLDLKIKEEGKNGNNVLRVHTTEEKAPIWYVHGFTIPLVNLGIDKIKDKSEVLDILNTQNGIPDSDTKTFLKKIIKDFGEIVNDGHNKLTYKTEHFKKQKDYFKVKRKAF